MADTDRSLAFIDRRVDLTLRLMSRRVLRAINLLHLGMWRLGLGPMLNAWPRWIGRYMLITTTGRRTGRKRRTSVNFTRIGEAVYCIAGWSPRSSWFANLLAEPRVEVWLPGERRKGLGQRVEDAAEATQAMRQLLVDTKGLSKLLAGVDADRIEDGAVEALTRRWPVVRIDLGEPERGPGPRPGDRAWVGFAAAAVVLACGLRRGSRRAR
jgi:deazaflavin-dependent oxidoreductase (nitroreductase family)